MNWQKNTPDETGDWLWVIMWDCGCCVSRCGIAFVLHADEEDEDAYWANDKYLSISWEHESNPPDVNHITAWARITLP